MTSRVCTATLLNLPTTGSWGPLKLPAHPDSFSPGPAPPGRLLIIQRCPRQGLTLVAFTVGALHPRTFLSRPSLPSRWIWLKWPSEGLARYSQLSCTMNSRETVMASKRSCATPSYMYRPSSTWGGSVRSHHWWTLYKPETPILGSGITSQVLPLNPFHLWI